MSLDKIQAATSTARKKLVDMAEAMDLKVPGDSNAKPRDTTIAPADVNGLVASPQLDRDPLTTAELRATHAASNEGDTGDSVKPRVNPAHVAQTLAAGIQDITNAMVEDATLSDVLRMILETMYRALDFQRLIFCMRDPKLDALTGRFGLGAGVEAVVRSFYVPLSHGAAADLFTTICLKGADTLINDTKDPRLANHLPAWYRKLYDAPTFLILPVAIKGKTVGLIYADKSEQGGLRVDEKELALLKTLRNQAVMAFKQLA
jgi:hypothetical protein